MTADYKTVTKLDPKRHDPQFCQWGCWSDAYLLHTEINMTDPESNKETTPLSPTLEVDPSDLYALHPEAVREPPTGFKGRLRFLGPGLILVGSVVGSGEIILTTSLGAMVGFSMLWFVLLSCWSKNIIQAELARFAIATGEPFLHAFDRLPGKFPAFNGKRVSWYIYFWLIWIIPGIFGGGGVYGGAGQIIHAVFPFLGSEWWTFVLAFGCSAIILTGSYVGIERLMTVMVFLFTATTITCAFLLQTTEYAITWDQVKDGLTFSFPAFAILAAIAMYGGTGVGTGEQVSYSYWCVEKGYARFTGPVDRSDEWVGRAKGWIKVMQLDVIMTLLLLTSVTIPFYMLGAGILHRIGEQPNGLETITVLSNIYTHTLGEWAFWLFMAGAFIVLYSTIVSGLGAGSRIFADGMAVLGLTKRNDYPTRVRVRRTFAVVVPLISSICYFIFRNPVGMLSIAHMIGAIQYPIFAGGAIYLRYKHLDQRVAPSRLANFTLWLCFIIMLVLAAYVKFLGYALMSSA